MFSISAMAIAASSGIARMTAGMSLSPAMLRRAPAPLAGDDLVALARPLASAARAAARRSAAPRPGPGSSSASSARVSGPHVEARLVAAALQQIERQLRELARRRARRGWPLRAGAAGAAHAVVGRAGRQAAPERGLSSWLTAPSPARRAASAGSRARSLRAQRPAPPPKRPPLRGGSSRRQAPGRPARRAIPCRATAPACRRRAPRRGGCCAE